MRNPNTQVDKIKRSYSLSFFKRLAIVPVILAMVCTGCEMTTTPDDGSDLDSASLALSKGGPTQACFTDALKAPLGCANENVLIERAAVSCGALGADLGIYRFGGKCKAGGYTAIKFQCCAMLDVVEPEEEPVEDKCFPDFVGGPKSCATVEDLEVQAAKTCGAEGADVTLFGASWECKEGKTKGYRFAKFLCCFTDDEPEIDPVLDDAETDSCWDASMGGPKECRTESSFEADAHEACANKGQALNLFSAGTPCMTKKGKGYRYAKFQCCDKADIHTDVPTDIDPDVAPIACFTDNMGGPKSCKTESTWEVYAASVCKDNTMALTQWTVGDVCKLKGEYGYRQVKFECCPFKDDGDTGDCDDDHPSDIITKPMPKPSKPDYTKPGNGISIKFDPEPTELDAGAESKPKPKPSDDDAAESKPKPKPSDDDDVVTKPKPKPEFCFMDSFGGDDWCAPESEWKAFSKMWCAAPGYTLERYKVGGTCGKDRYHMVKMECCGNSPLTLDTQSK